MTFIRLSELTEKTGFPSDAILALISSNTVSMRVNEAGYLEVELTEVLAKELIAGLTQYLSGLSSTPAFKTFEERLSLLAEGIVREELESILHAALGRIVREPKLEDTP